MHAVTRRAILCLMLLAAPSIAFAHATDANEWHEVLSTWEFDPMTCVLLVLSALLYFVGVKRLRAHANASLSISHHRVWSYWLGWLSLVVALVSPIHAAGEELFSAHMLQHELLMLVSAPLLVLGRPLVPFVWALPQSWRVRIGSVTNASLWRKVWKFLTLPFAAWTIHSVAVWFWHAPALFQLAVENETAHALQHLSFLATALLYYWSTSEVLRRGRFGLALVLLFLLAVHTGILGAWLTFSTRLWYPIYAHHTAAFGLTALEDQQIGGLIMWVPAGTLYTIAALVCGARWFNRTAVTAFPQSLIVTASK
jgi:putative membrane protein